MQHSKALIPLLFLWWTTALLSGMGCSIDREIGDFPDLDAGVALDSQVNPDGQVDVAIDLDGHWLLFTEDRRCIVPGLGETVENIVWTDYLVRFSREDEQSAILSVNLQICRQVLSPLPFNFITVVPEAVVNNLPELDFNGFLVGDRVGATFVTEPAVHLWGYQDGDVSAPLPVDGEDERVLDQDQDGLPGLSMPVLTEDGNEICQVRVVQRNTLQLEGNVASADRIKGRLSIRPEEVILATSTALCAGGDVSKSTASDRFELLKLDDDVTDCEMLRAQIDMIRQRLSAPESTPDGAQHCPE